MSTPMAITIPRSSLSLMIIAFILWMPLIISCDKVLTPNNNPNNIVDKTNVNIEDNNEENLIRNDGYSLMSPELTSFIPVDDDSIVSSMYQQKVCRKNMLNMVYELCRPYFTAVRRQMCDTMSYRFKPMSKNDRKLCRQKTGEAERRKSIQQLVEMCCEEACSLNTLTKYCRMRSPGYPVAMPSSYGPPPPISAVMLSNQDIDDMLVERSKVRLPMFRPPSNFGQYDN